MHSTIVVFQAPLDDTLSRDQCLAPCESFDASFDGDGLACGIGQTISDGGDAAAVDPKGS